MIPTQVGNRARSYETYVIKHRSFRIHFFTLWQPCIFKLKVHTYEVFQSIKQLIFFCKYSTMSGRGRRGRPRRVIPKAFECPAVPERDKHVVGSTTASMNQPPAVGQA